MIIETWGIADYIKTIFKDENEQEKNKMLKDVEEGIKRIGNLNHKFEFLLVKYIQTPGAALFPRNKSNEDPDLSVMIYPGPIGQQDTESIEISMISTETGKTARSSIEKAKITNKNLSSLICEKISRGLGFSDDLLRVNADKLIDAEKSQVQFQLSSLSGEKVLLDFDFTADYTDIQNVKFSQFSGQKGEPRTYEFHSEQGKVISITFSGEGENSKVQVDTNFRPTDNTKTSFDIFTLTSVKGYRIDFEFSWAGNDIANVRVFPRLKPCNTFEEIRF